MRKSKAFTLIELLVVVAIIAVLVAILLPALNSARESARKVVCMSNVKQIGVGLVMYGQDYNEIPTSSTAVLNWTRQSHRGYKPLLDEKYIRDIRVLYCPSDTNHRFDGTGECRNSGYCTYLYWHPVYIHFRSDSTVTVFEYPPNWFEIFITPTPWGGFIYKNPHKDGFSALASDGTTGWIPDHAGSDLGIWDWNEIDRRLGVTGVSD